MIRDRGKIKWTPAAFMPEQSAMLRKMWQDAKKIQKSILDEYEIADIENKIHYAMEYNLEIGEVWFDGFVESIQGNVHHLDPLKKIILFKDVDDDAHRIPFDDITKIYIID